MVDKNRTLQNNATSLDSEKNQNHYSIDAFSNDRFYVVLLDGVEFCKVSKKNDIEKVKQHFGIKNWFIKTIKNFILVLEITVVLCYNIIEDKRDSVNLKIGETQTFIWNLIITNWL